MSISESIIEGQDDALGALAQRLDEDARELGNKDEEPRSRYEATPFQQTIVLATLSSSIGSSHHTEALTGFSSQLYIVKCSGDTM